MNANKIIDKPVPPIIKEYATQTMSTNVPDHVRNNYRDMLENIINVCNYAINQFDIDQQRKAIAIAKKQTKRAK